VPFDRIVDALWDEPPSSAIQQVYNIVGDLRRRLEKVGIRIEVVTSSTGYQLTLPAFAVDALRFRASTIDAARAEARGLLSEAIASLNQALSEWRGLAFSGLSSRHLQNIATTLAEERVAAAEHLAELHLHQGDSATAVRGLLELVAEHPFRESLRALLMRALYQVGRQADALAVFEEGRRLLADELGLDPGLQLLAAQQLVLTGSADDEFSVRERSAGGHHLSQAEPGRSFLPRDLPEFTGREDEVRQLLAGARLTHTTALIISALDGMGGVGKTTLAVHLAHKLAEHYPDGQYFIDLLGFSAGAKPLPPLQALDMLLRNSGTPPELIPPELEVRSALWRSSVAGRRVLLLLDNAADAAQVRPLLPGAPGSLVLISSRRRMTALEGAVPLALDVMPREDAISLFRQIVGQDRITAEHEAASVAIELCGRLPLAIQVAAARLRDRPSWSVAYLVEQLSDQQSRARILSLGDRDVMGILAWSYRHLTPRQQELFRLLGLHRGPDFDAHAIAALAGLSINDAIICLEDLFDVNLLQQHASGRYRFHDLVRDCSLEMLRQHCDDAARTSATERILDYYLRSANVWCKALGRSAFHFDPVVTHDPQTTYRPETSEDATKLLETEFPNLLAVTRLAAEIGAHTRTWQLTCSLLPYFAHLNYGMEVEKLLEQALHSARAVGSVTGESACLTGLSHAKYLRGLKEQARELLVQAIELSQQHGDRAMEVFQRTGLGAMYYMGDNCADDALVCFTGALELARAIGDLQAEADLVNNLGVMCMERGRLDEALAYYHRTLALSADVSAGRTQGQNNIGKVLCLQGEYSDAAVKFEEALHLSRSVGSRRSEAEALIGLCSVCRLLGDCTRSFECGREALEVARSSSMRDMEADALNTLGDTYLAIGDIETAEVLYNKANEIAVMYKSARHTAQSYEGLAHVMSARGDLEAARENWIQALAIQPGGVADAIGARRHLATPGYGVEFCWRCASS
jgi:DNA-binding SARP family transcriptional activator/Tfp pilus assembly protein PilF